MVNNSKDVPLTVELLDSMFAGFRQEMAIAVSDNDSPKYFPILVRYALKLEDYLPEVDRLDWTCTSHEVAAADEERKLEAISQYSSQVRAFGGMARVRAFTRRGHKVLGGERIWSCRPGSPR